MSDDARRARFLARFARVLDHIDAHPQEAPGVETLSALAAYSPHHFHRQFTALMGMPVGRYALLARLRRASYLLAFQRDVPVGDVAAQCGYEGPEAFARAFRQIVGASPTEFRARPDWADWHVRFQPWLDARTRLMPTEPTTDDVEVIERAPTRIALLVHHGDPRGLNDSIQRFITWRRRVGLPRDRHATFNVLYADPVATPPEEFRMGIAVATDGEIAPNAEGVAESFIPGGPFARLRHVGSTDFLEPAFRCLYGQWLPTAEWEPGDFPPLLQRLKFFPEVPDAQAETDVLVPLVRRRAD
jgi:AraC family transcriptional regulator